MLLFVTKQGTERRGIVDREVTRVVTLGHSRNLNYSTKISRIICMCLPAVMPKPGRWLKAGLAFVDFDGQFEAHNLKGYGYPCAGRMPMTPCEVIMPVASVVLHA
jgi:hypothetical protein